MATNPPIVEATVSVIRAVMVLVIAFYVILAALKAGKRHPVVYARRGGLLWTLLLTILSAYYLLASIATSETQLYLPSALLLTAGTMLLAGILLLKPDTTTPTRIAGSTLIASGLIAGLASTLVKDLLGLGNTFFAGLLIATTPLLLAPRPSQEKPWIHGAVALSGTTITLGGIIYETSQTLATLSSQYQLALIIVFSAPFLTALIGYKIRSNILLAVLALLIVEDLLLFVSSIVFSSSTREEASISIYTISIIAGLTIFWAIIGGIIIGEELKSNTDNKSSTLLLLLMFFYQSLLLLSTLISTGALFYLAFSSFSILLVILLFVEAFGWSFGFIASVFLVLYLVVGRYREQLGRIVRVLAGVSGLLLFFVYFIPLVSLGQWFSLVDVGSRVGLLSLGALVSVVVVVLGAFYYYVFHPRVEIVDVRVPEEVVLGVPVRVEVVVRKEGFLPKRVRIRAELVWGGEKRFDYTVWETVVVMRRPGEYTYAGVLRPVFR